MKLIYLVARLGNAEFVRMNAKSIFRDVQSRLPWLLDVKTGTQRIYRNFRKIPFEAEYGLIKYLDTNIVETYVDVGANRGQSIDAIRLYHPNAPITSFEPNPHLARRLKKIFQSDQKLTLHNMGLGRKAEILDFYIPYYRKFMYDGLASFSKANATEWLNAHSVWRFDPKHLNIETHKFKIQTLDSYELNPDFLKVHVQGFEHEVLLGSVKTIETNNPIILIANNAQADHWLREFGWRQYRYVDGSLAELKANDPDLYNCYYLNPDHQPHIDLIQSLSA